LRVQEFGCKHDGSFKLVPKMDVIVIGYFFWQIMMLCVGDSALRIILCDYSFKFYGG
jgi:hypothetical protein